MSSRVCLVHYHEIGLKGRNRYAFERRLSDNLKAALVSFPIEEIVRISGYILVTFTDENDADAIAAAIAATPGVVRVSTGWRCGRDLDEICAQAAVALFDAGSFDTFRVSSKRSNTDFPLTSVEVNVRVGSYLCGLAPDKKVKLKNPDTEVHITIVQGSAYVYSRSIHGVGGLPVGSAGRVVSLLSAGIDSPVATWKMIRRGAIALCVHFSGRPQTSDSSEHLVREIVETLQPAAGIARLYIVPFGDYQREISLACPPELRVIMYRRLMFCVAERIAQIEHAGALVTGESLGQVASQTLANIRATDDVAELPVFRPLIGSDKQEIIRDAEALHTFEISIQNQSDCCTLFMPRNPETHAHLPRVRSVWATLPIDDWLDEILENVEVEEFPCPAYEAIKPKKKSI